MVISARRMQASKPQRGHSVGAPCLSHRTLHMRNIFEHDKKEKAGLLTHSSPATDRNKAKALEGDRKGNHVRRDVADDHDVGRVGRDQLVRHAGRRRRREGVDDGNHSAKHADTDGSGGEEESSGLERAWTGAARWWCWALWCIAAGGRVSCSLAGGEGCC